MRDLLRIRTSKRGLRGLKFFKVSLTSTGLRMVAHNTDFNAASHILSHGVWRPSKYDEKDGTWSPRSTLHARDHLSDEPVALMQAALHRSDAGHCCVLSRALVQQHARIRPESGGVHKDIVAGMFYDAIRSKDARWAFTVSTSRPTGNYHLPLNPPLNPL